MDSIPAQIRSRTCRCAPHRADTGPSPYARSGQSRLLPVAV